MPPLEYVSLPYVRGGSIGELIRMRGRNAADAEMRRGEIAARMWSDLGQQIGAGIQGYAKEREMAPIRAREAEAAELDLQAKRDAATERNRQTTQARAFEKSLMQWDGNPDALMEMSVRTYGPQRGPQEAASVLEGYEALRKLQSGRSADARGDAQRVVAQLMRLSPDGREAFRPALEQAGRASGLVREGQELGPLTDEALTGMMGFLTGQEPERPNLIQRDPTKDLVHPTTGEVVTPGTPEPDKVTYGQPVAAMVNGRRVFVRPGSDGQSYSMTGAPVQGNVTPVVDAGADNEPLVSIVGPDGKPVLVRRRDAVGKSPATGSQKPASGLEKRALNFFNRARQADVDLEALESDIRELSFAGQLRGALAPNFLQSDLGQLYTQAQRAFTEARLRKDSGAAIPPQEFENDRQTYFVQPGDSEETIEQKHRARAAILSSLGFESGQALGEFEGDMEAAQAIVQGYKDRAARKAAVPDDNVQTPNLSGLREGNEREFRDGPFKGQVWTIVNGQAVKVR